MLAPPPPADFQVTASEQAGSQPVYDEPGRGRSLGKRTRGVRWIGWRLRGLVAVALLGCLGLLLLIRALAAVPSLPLTLLGNDRGMLLLTDPSGTPRAVRSVVDAEGRAVALDALLLQRSARWLVGDVERARHATQHDALALALAAGPVQLMLTDGRAIAVTPMPHGAGGLGALFWLACTLALLLYLVTMVVILAQPEARNALYAVMALAQVGNLLFLATESIPDLGLPAGFMRWDHDLRAAFDLASGAALVHAAGLHPRRLGALRVRASGAWLIAMTSVAALIGGQFANAWWWTQAIVIGCGLLAVAQLAWVQRSKPHPLAAVLWRFCALMVGTLILLTLSIAVVGPHAGSLSQAVSIGADVWVVCVATMLLMLPFMARTQPLMREFALLAGVSTLATSLDLLFVALFSLGNFASLTLALFIALGIYAGLRQWLRNQMMARERITTERMFEHLYRMAREVQAEPQSVGAHLSRLLREMFEPLEVELVARHSSRSHVAGDGASLLVPVPQLAPSAAPGVIVLGMAQRGGRMFTADDARLADQVVDQLSRAVAFDQAVERGRSEERVRIAQDLHDDIGARLLTLMYQAPTREMEDYLRHTLKDLKTLTRGLAAPNHRLSHAIAEWKADITQRLSAADCEFAWAFTYDRDFELTVVQWSALTRVLRELISNTIAHAGATQVHVDASLEGGQLTLTVADNGRGKNPDAWSHGLGLGGVRKRVRQLGGNVLWRENGATGIVCHVTIPGLGQAAAEPTTKKGQPS
jgi:signal transduction histidine kinase